MRRFLPALIVSLLSAVIQAQTIITKFELGGSPIGENVYEGKPDGTFTSNTKLTIMGAVIQSDLSGTFREGELVKFTLDQKRDTTSSKITYENGKAVVESGAQKKEMDVKPGKAIFGNYHPQLIKSIIDALDKSTPGPKEIEVFVVDSGGKTKISVMPKPNNVVGHQGKEISAPAYLLRFGNIDIDYVLTADGVVLGMNVPAQQFVARAEGYTDVFVDPTTKYKELSQPTFKVKSQKGVAVPMRDGVPLKADVFMPDANGSYPTVLYRTPYSRSGVSFMGDWYAKRGYVFVAQDVRGTGESDGIFRPFENERKDGYDTIDWISKQAWSDKKVGMIGASYGGLVQWAAAAEKHPALKCIIPQVSPPDAFFNLPYDYGIPMLMGSLWWSNLVKTKVADMSLASKPLPHPEKFTTLPLTKIDDEVLGTNIPFFDSWWKRETPNQFVGFDYLKAISTLKIPALHISGWWDGDGIGTKLNFAAARKGGNENQWLIYGPWTHAFNSTSKLGDVDYGPTAIMELDSLYLRWFDTWLKGKDVNLKAVPKVRVFVTGANVWRDLSDWPEPKSKQTTLYMSRPGKAGLLTDKAVKDQKPSTYTYDPAQVEVPEEFKKAVVGGEGSLIVPLPKDESDNLVFKTDVLRQPITIAGPIQVDLHFSTTAKDTDFFAVLMDEDEKGVTRIVCHIGKIRARYLSGWNTPKLLNPGKEYKATIDLWDTAHQFKPGHKIVLMIMSSNFPAYARNLNTGEPNATGTAMVVAKQTIFHDAKRPSSLSFRVLSEK